jgi:S1-C subfamily serine protease
VNTRLVSLVVVCALALAAAPRAVVAGTTELDKIQKEFKTANENGVPATVSVIAQDSEGPACSGVMVSASGLVLSDYDAGVVVKRGQATSDYARLVKVRVPDMKTGAFVEYDGAIVKSIKELDSALIKIAKPPGDGFKYLVPATADDLHVGSFTFVAGNSFGMGSESLPAMTAGVLAAATYRPRGEASAGRYESLYPSAAVTPGVSGGPLLDVDGRLVGVIRGFEPVTPDNPYQFLGRATPIDRLRAAYASTPEARDAFDEKAAKRFAGKVTESAALETVIARAADDSYPSVASLVVERREPLNTTTFTAKGPVPLPRYVGPCSAPVVGEDGWLLTSLYNLTNTGGMLSVSYMAALPPAARVSAGLAAITKITAYFSDGSSADARLVATHEGLGFALLKIDVKGRRAFAPAPASAYDPGRFLVPVANPYGAKQQPDPLINFGIVSKRHPDDAPMPWRGEIQTDAGGTDGNCGAAVVDIEGRLVGVMTLWSPVDHGRNSGVAFVVPWDKIEPALDAMKQGRSFRLPRLGVTWGGDSELGAIISEVAKEGAAEKAGIRPGDVVVKIGALAVKSVADLGKAVAGHYAGDRMTFVVSRNGQTVTVDVELGARD